VNQHELGIGVCDSVTGVLWRSRVRFLNQTLAAKAKIAVETKVVKLLVVLSAAVSFLLS